jgi:molybdate transport system ATP-binding protein
LDKVARTDETAPDGARLRVEIRHRIGTLTADASFTLRQPWTILFGPSGSGKSTILRAIAGLVRPDAGRIAWAATDKSNSVHLTVTVVDSSANRFVPPARRGFPLAPQLPSLFPHWSVLENLTMRRKPADHADIEEIVSLFHLGHLRGKMPSALSGGEAQRVNLARASAWTMRGSLLLLDEPFTGMDAALRDEILRDMQAWAAKRDVCVLSVTHDVAEAFQLGAEVIKIAEGKVVAQGPVETVLTEERERLLKQLQASGC